MKKLQFFISVLLLHSTLNSTIAFAKQNEKNGQQEFVSGELLVRFKPGTLPAGNGLKAAKNTALDQVFHRIGVNNISLVTQTHTPTNNGKQLKSQRASLPEIYKLSFDTTVSVADATQQLHALACVEKAAPNYRRHLAGNIKQVEQNALFSSQKNIEETNIKALWQLPTTSSERPVIAILDTGVDHDHADLSDNMWKNEAEANGLPGIDDDRNGFVDDVYGYNFGQSTAEISDSNGHGTHCAGVAAAVNNKIGIVGLNPEALIMGLPVTDSQGTITSELILKALDYAVKNGADVVSMSIGSYNYSEVEDDSFLEASKHCLLVAAAGNNGLSSETNPFFPAAYASVLGVENTGYEDNYDDNGPYFNLNGFGYQTKAPGQDIISTACGGYRLMTGTSMACPCVAGIASRLLQCKHYENLEVLKNDIINATGPEGIDAYKAYLGCDYTQPKIELGAYQYEVKQNEDGMVQYIVYPSVQNISVPVDNISVSIISNKGVEQAKKTIAHLNKSSVYVFDEPFVITRAANLPDQDNYTICLEAGETSVSKELFFMIPDTLNGCEYSKGNIEWKGYYTFDKKLYLTAKDTLFIRPGARINISDEAFLMIKGTVVAKGEKNKPIAIKGSIMNFTPSSTIEYVDFTGVANNNFTDCKFKNCSFSNIYSRGVFATNSVFDHCSFTNVKADYFDVDCQFYNCNIYHCESGYWTSNLNEVTDYFLNPTHFYNCNIFNNSIGDTYRNYSLIYNSQVGETVAMGAPCYLGDEAYTPIRERVLDSKNPTSKIGNGVINVDDRLPEVIADAPCFAYKIYADGDDLLRYTSNAIHLPYYIKNLEVHFNQAMRTTSIPKIAQFNDMQNARWENEYLFKASVIIRKGTTIEGEELIKGFLDEDGNTINTHTDVNSFVTKPAGSNLLGFKGRFEKGKVNLSWKAVDADVKGYNLYRYTETEFLAENANGIRINKDVLPTTQVSYTDLIPTSTTEEDFVYCLTKVQGNGEEQQVYNWILVRYKRDEEDEYIKQDDEKESTTGCSLNNTLAEMLELFEYFGEDHTEVEYPCYDLNNDEQFDVFDMVRMWNKIDGEKHVSTQVPIITYFVKDSVVYVNSNIDLAAIQVKLNDSDIEYGDILEGMEHYLKKTKEDGYELYAYSYNGTIIPKGVHPLFKLNNSIVFDHLQFCDVTGKQADAQQTGPQNPANATPTYEFHYYDLQGKEVTAETAKNTPGYYILSIYENGKLYDSIKFRTTR